MGNRAIITTKERGVGLYLHWNGGRDSIEAFLEYCRLKGYRSPGRERWSYEDLERVVRNFIGDRTTVKVIEYVSDREAARLACDNGVYVVDGWSITDRVLPNFGGRGFREQSEYGLDGMLAAIDKAQPEAERLEAIPTER